MKVIRRMKALLHEWRDGVNPPVFFDTAAFNVALIQFAGQRTDTTGLHSPKPPAISLPRHLFGVDGRMIDKST